MEQSKPYLRHVRVSDLIEEELSKIMLKEVELQPNTLATITEVVVTKKLDQAKVYLSVIPSEQAEKIVETLNKRSKYLGALLLRKLNIRPLPQLNFIVDHGNENAADIEKALLDS